MYKALLALDCFKVVLWTYKGSIYGIFRTTCVNREDRLYRKKMTYQKSINAREQVSILGQRIGTGKRTYRHWKQNV